MLLDLGREAEQPHNPGHPGGHLPTVLATAGRSDPHPAYDSSRVHYLAVLEEHLSVNGFAEECDRSERPRALGRLPVENPGRSGVHDPVDGHPARQGAGVTVFE